MSVGEIILWWLLAAVGLAGSMLCSGTETGLYATNSVRALVRSRSQGATNADRVIAAAVDKPERSLTTLLLFNNAFNYLATLAVTTLLLTLAFSQSALIVIQAAVLTPVLLIFAESLPKELFRAHTDRLVRRAAPLLAVMQWVGVWSGLVPLIAGLARLGAMLFRTDARDALGSDRERVADLIKHGSETMSEAQAGLIDRALRVEATRVGDEMVPIHAATTVRVSWVAARARREIERAPHARYPVLDDRGRVAGVVLLSELVLNPGATVGSLMSEPVRLDHAMSAWEALRRMRAEDAGMGIVERQGHAVGLVTRKDLAEPLTGDLRDW
ncbi:MAG: CNNM domain-containing protein [Phycisphaerales bacterium]|nr:DUF21 domain-containing protein [Planctomycetota bacterium]MCH8508637.1 CNNM domain-containing protein [Phycisphaerales bacterium]